MKVSNETKVGALTAISITLLILGFNFLKGRTLFKTGHYIFAKYEDTKGLMVSNPVYINGFQVGTVMDIENDDASLHSITLTLKMKEFYQIPVNSLAEIRENPLGTPSVIIRLGNANTFLKAGDTVKTQNLPGMIASLVDNNEKVNKILSQTETTTAQLSKTDFSGTVEQLKTAVSNLNTLLTNIQSDKGTLGKLINDKTLYLQLNETLKSTNTLMDDLRLHPKRYVSFSVFGKKDKSGPIMQPLHDSIPTPR
jgi:phospholipid/cholesterol/gamma-HCH transport system substrate-binding protein